MFRSASHVLAVLCFCTAFSGLLADGQLNRDDALRYAGVCVANPGKALKQLKEQCREFVKEHESEETTKLRMNLLVRRAKDVQALNGAADQTWFSTINCLSIMTDAEIGRMTPHVEPEPEAESVSDNYNDGRKLSESVVNRRLLGGKSSRISAPSPTRPPSPTPPPTTLPPPPSTTPHNWRNVSGISYVTPVKNQGSCGSCWAFAAAAVLESMLMISKGATSPDVSEQQAMDCTYDLAYNSCNGGWQYQAWAMWINRRGASSEAQYPYRSVDQACATSVVDAFPLVSTTVTNIVNFWQSKNVNNTEAIKQTLKAGPLTVTIDTPTEFNSYGGGVLSCSPAARASYDHAVVVVGWEAATATLPEHWIIKNSWGSGWGSSGYVRINTANDFDCGVAKWRVDQPIIL